MTESYDMKVRCMMEQLVEAQELGVNPLAFEGHCNMIGDALIEEHERECSSTSAGSFCVGVVVGVFVAVATFVVWTS